VRVLPPGTLDSSSNFAYIFSAFHLVAREDTFALKQSFFQKNRYLSLVKIEHTLFTLPLVYGGLVLGLHGAPSVRILLLVLLSAVGARTTAFALNRIIDRDIDKRNPRTASRELPTGRVTLGGAIGVLALGTLLYLTSAAMISTFCLALSPVPLIIFALYPYMKRFTALAHFGVGLGMAMAPLGGWFAASPSFDNLPAAALLCLFTLFWGAGFDIIYATLDEEFDRREHLYSFVSRFGRQKALFWSSVLHGIAFACLSLLFFTTIRTWYAAPFLLTTGALLWLEQRKADDVQLAFFKINAGLGFLVFAMIVTGAVVR